MYRSCVGSKISSHSVTESVATDLSDVDLVKRVTELKKQVRVIKLENEILEKAIIRLDPTLMHGVYKAYEYATKRHSEASAALSGINLGKSQISKVGRTDSSMCTSKILMSPSKISNRSSAIFTGSTVSGLRPKINVNERMELVSVEKNNLVAKLDKVKNDSMKKHAVLRAHLEEIGLRVNIVEDACKMFTQEVLIEGWDKIAQRVPAEAWIKFLSEWIKVSDRQIEKLRLRTSTLNAQFIKLKGQVKVKSELREILYPIDIEKLKIDNNECVKLITQKMLQLEELKKLTGRANLHLTRHQRIMLYRNCYLTEVERITKIRELEADKLNQKGDAILEEAIILEEKLIKLKKARRNYEVPDVIDYVKLKLTLSDLKHSIKLLERRAHIKEINLTAFKQKFRIH